MNDSLRSRTWLIALGLLVLTVAAYLPALGCGFIWDDDDYVTENPTLRTFAGLVQMWSEPTSIPQYYPLVHTTFWLEFQTWGPEPLGYHLVNVLLHGANAILLWRVLASLSVPGALLAAALFAVHPVHVESVAWITERKNVLSLWFYLLAVLAWMRWRQPAGSRSAYALLVVSFVAALLSKTVTCSLPAALLLVTWWQSGRISRRDVVAMAPLFVLGIGFALATVYLEQSHVGAEGVSWELSPAQRLLLATRAPWFYAAKLAVPVSLSFVYPRWSIDPSSFAQWGFVVASITLLVALWRLRDRIGRGPLVAVLLFGGTLVPALGLFDVYPFRYSFVADHFQYHASIGLIALAAAGLARLRVARLAAVPIVALAVLTWMQCGWYLDLETLWRKTLEVNPNATIAHTNLGRIVLGQGDVDTAAAHLERALEIEEDFFEAHINLAAARYSQGDVDATERHLRRATELRPDRAIGWHNLAKVVLRNGDARQALDLARRAVELEADFRPAHLLIADILIQLKRPKEAIEHLDRALRLDPDDLPTRRLAVECLLSLGQFNMAVGNALVVLRQDPRLSSSRTNLDLGLDGLAAEGKRAEAAHAARTAADILRKAGNAEQARRYDARAAQLQR